DVGGVVAVVIAPGHGGLPSSRDGFGFRIRRGEACLRPLCCPREGEHKVHPYPAADIRREGEHKVRPYGGHASVALRMSNPTNFSSRSLSISVSSTSPPPLSLSNSLAIPVFWAISSSILSSTVPRQTNLCTKTLRF